LLEVGKSTYTNKVDIWAIGCIFYEIIVRRKLFADDWAVVQYASQGSLHSANIPIAIDSEAFPDERRQTFIADVIHEMLEVDWNKRPRADELLKRFVSWDNEIQPAMHEEVDPKKARMAKGSTQLEGTCISHVN